MELLQALMANLPGFKPVADNKELLGRCSFCGDSANISSAHLYIGPLKSDDKPLYYHCKKCGSTGILDANALRELGVYDYELIGMVTAYNNEILNNPSYMHRFNTYKGIMKASNTLELNDNITQAKLNYINRRLGTCLTLKEAMNNKIVFNLKYFLEENGITTLTRDPNIVEELSTYFIGFLSYDNCYLNMRRLCKEGIVYSSIDKRYVNYNLYNKIDNSMRYYVLPTIIDTLQLEPVHVYITEGPFDILSLKYNVDKFRDSIFISVGGKSYLVGVKFVIQQLGLINVVIHLCPDGDVDDYTMYNIANYIRPFNLNIDMMRNKYKGEKDFGVPLSHIEVVVESLNKRRM